MGKSSKQKQRLLEEQRQREAKLKALAASTPSTPPTVTKKVVASSIAKKVVHSTVAAPPTERVHKTVTGIKQVSTDLGSAVEKLQEIKDTLPVGPQKEPKVVQLAPRGQTTKSAPEKAVLEIPTGFHSGVINSIERGENNEIRWFLADVTVDTATGPITKNLMCHASKFPSDISGIKEKAVIRCSLDKFQERGKNPKLVIQAFEVKGSLPPVVERILKTFQQVQKKVTVFSDVQLASMLVDLPETDNENELISSFEDKYGSKCIGVVNNQYVFTE